MARNRINHNKGTKLMIDSIAALICFRILLNMAEMGAYAKGVRIIEYEPVLIRNKHQNGYLVLAGRHDSDRNNVRIAQDIVTDQHVTLTQDLNVGLNLGKASISSGLSIASTVPVGYSHVDAKWNLISTGNGEYEIVHNAFNQPLYAASNPFAYDDYRRRVFTWKPGPSVLQGFWKFEKAPIDGYYMIKNTVHGEYLYGADYPKKGNVFTWRYVENHDAGFNDKFYWQLIKFTGTK